MAKSTVILRNRMAEAERSGMGKMIGRKNSQKAQKFAKDVSEVIVRILAGQVGVVAILLAKGVLVKNGLFELVLMCFACWVACCEAATG